MAKTTTGFHREKKADLTNPARMPAKKKNSDSNSIEILDVGHKSKRNKVDIRSKWIVDEIRADYQHKL